MPEHTDLERDLRFLETTLRRLETEYTMFFAGQLPKPPLETRSRVETLLRRYDRAYIQSYPDRFRLNTLQSRFSAFVQLWDRGLRAREEGRPGPFSKGPREAPPPPSVPAIRAEVATPAPAPPPSGPSHGAVDVTVGDPQRDAEKVESLYRALVAARRETGNEETLPFGRFAQMVKSQVSKLRGGSGREVAFRVAVRDGKVMLTAKAIKAVAPNDGEGSGDGK